MKNNTPNPGSTKAQYLGCTCPVLDNGGGNGRGDGSFWINQDCPLHNESEPEKKKESQ